MKSVFVVPSLLVLWSFAFAAPPPTPPSTPPPEVAKTVDAFNGKWTLETTMTAPGGKPVKFAETVDCHKGAHGRAVICVDRSTVPGEPPTEYDYLVGYDADTKMVHLFTVGSPGEVHDHRCKWNDDKVLECEPLKATLGGQPITETFAFTFEGNKLTLKGMTVTADGPIAFEASGKRSGS
jgi:hypothetical protein